MSTRADESYGMGKLSRTDRLGVWLSLRAVRRALSRHARTGPLRALDIGCGYHASLLTALSPRLETATAVDFRLNPRLAEREGFVLQEGNVEERLPCLPSASYDLVLLINVLEHLNDDGRALVECRRLLAPGGLLLVNVPTWLGKRALEFSAFRLGWSPRLEMDDHKAYYDLKDLWPLLVKAGFKPSGLFLRYHKFGLNLFAEAWAGDKRT